MQRHSTKISFICMKIHKSFTRLSHVLHEDSLGNRGEKEMRYFGMYKNLSDEQNQVTRVHQNEKNK